MRAFLVISCVVVGATLALATHADDRLSFLHGVWLGNGHTSGLEASIQQTWQPTLNNEFTSLRLRNRMTGENGKIIEFVGNGYYHLVDDAVSGVWIDSTGDILPLDGSVEGNTLSVVWGSSGTKLGRSQYRLLSDDKLQVTNATQNSKGEWQEFGRAVLSRKPSKEDISNSARITGIGGVFFKARRDAKELSSWYEERLGIKLEDFGGAIMKWQEDAAEDNGITVWHVADSDSEWFSPSQSSFMINYRVDDLNEMIRRLERAGEVLQRGPESHENGKFAWIMDPDGNKIELWEPKIWNEANKQNGK